MKTLRKLTAVLAGALALGAAACENGVTAPPGEAVGTYTLVSANGQTLPFVVRDNATSRIVLDTGTMVIEADGDFTMTLNFTESAGGQSAPRRNITEGTVSINGSSARFDGRLAGSFDGTLTGGVLTIDVVGSDGSLQLRFNKQ